MIDVRVLSGTRGLRLSEVKHIFIPGGGRLDGEALTVTSRERVKYAAALYRQLDLARSDGSIVCSGYKSPADIGGNCWTPPDAPNERFVGVPEADLMKGVLIEEGVESRVVQLERHSIDTVTNLVFTEAGGYLSVGSPVAIVSQERHLRRILDIIAPRTLHRPYLGVVVPDSNERSAEGILPRLASRAILAGIGVDTDMREISAVTHRRATRAWQIVNAILRVARISTPYDDPRPRSPDT